MESVCESNIILLSVHLASLHLSFMLSLPKHWVEFNQTYYMTSPHGKGVQEQHYFTIRLVSRHPFICPSGYLLQNHWVDFYKVATELPFMVRECEGDSVCPLVMLLATWTTSMWIGNGMPSTAHSNFSYFSLKTYDEITQWGASNGYLHCMFS